MFSSIRWTLLFWYALILAAVLGAFGTTLYLALRRSALHEIDARLRSHAQTLAGSAEWDRGGNNDDKGEGRDAVPRESAGGRAGKLEMDLPDAYLAAFRKGGGDEPYFVIWDPAGRVADRSHPDLEIPRPGGPGERERERRREVTVAGRDGLTILVGQHTRKVLERLRELLGVTVGVGAAVLALALAGGWFLASRALGPVRRISETASSISASSLSQRIDVARTENELGELAATLNGTFDRLEAAFDRQARFTADASHELRTPLSIVLSHAELALRKERSGEEYRDALGTCLTAAQRMRGIVDGLLTLARADTGEARLKREPADLRRLLEETAALLRTLAEKAGVALEVAAEDVTVTGDADRLREVAMNLLSNAIRYNRPGGRISATLRAEGGEAVLAVADTGLGIPEKDQPHIFERFFRVDKARSRDAGGSGLGLSIAKWIVESHGGTIVFTSREGEGTTFTVRLPRGGAPDDKATVPLPGDPPPA
jgi:two-component system, OmpR family, sensor kinase